MDADKPSNVTVLGTGKVVDPVKINEEAMATLRDMMAFAEAGQIESVAIAYVCNDGWCKTSFSLAPYGSQMKLLGNVTLLQHRLSKNINDED